MTLPNRDQFGKRDDSGAHETLRMIAQLRAPQGLRRVGSGQECAQGWCGGVVAGRKFRRLAQWKQSGWFRGAAAAAIVAIVVGGGWEVSMRFPAGGCS